MINNIHELFANHFGIAIACAIGAVSSLYGFYHLSLKIRQMLKNRKKEIEKRTILDLIGNTPLIYLPTLSKATSCQIYCKLELANPFGSSKDRAVKRMIFDKTLLNESTILDAKEVVEASSGSTAISLVQLAHILKLKPTLFMPDDLAEDKYLLLDTLKANVIKVPPVSIVDENHFFNLALKYSETTKALFTNQFQNLSNAKVHEETTGPEIYHQTQGLLDAFVCSAGTGGTIAGVSKFLKQKNENIKIILADPEGSGLLNKVKYNVLFTNQQKQGYRLKNPFDTVIEGVGLNRPTSNFDLATIDDAYKVTDLQALHMGHYLIENEGLFVGGSSALNLAAVVKFARKNVNKTIVTVIHDSGTRYLKKFYSQKYLNDKNIKFERKETYSCNDLDFIK